MNKTTRCAALFCALTTRVVTEKNNGGVPGPADLNVVWAAPTNSWPEKLWTYKVVPQDFPEAVVSNLLRISSFNLNDRTKTPAVFAEKDAKTLFFGELEGSKKHLAVCPTLGFVDYFDPAAESHGNAPVLGVPDQLRSTELALNYLRCVGIDLSQIAIKTATGELDLHWGSQTSSWLDQPTKTQSTVTNRLTVFFRRRIDGLNVGGIGLNGGFLVGFGNHEKVVELQVYWRNLRPYELRECATPSEILERIMTGKVPLPATAGPKNQISKLAITYAVPYYAARFGDEPESYVKPALDVVAVVERPDGQVTIQFQVPILK